MNRGMDGANLASQADGISTAGTSQACGFKSVGLTDPTPSGGWRANRVSCRRTVITQHQVATGVRLGAQHFQHGSAGHRGTGSASLALSTDDPIDSQTATDDPIHNAPVRSIPRPSVMVSSPMPSPIAPATINTGN